MRVIAVEQRFVFGEYRRHMKTIGYLGQLDNVFGGAATTRNWNTITTIVRILKGPGDEKPPVDAPHSATRGRKPPGKRRT